MSDDTLTQDRFLGGKLQIWQPKHGYRAGADPVFLAASTPAQPGQSVLELGCGAGVASLCLFRRVAGLDLYGVELQPEYADLARRNALENNVNFKVYDCDLAKLPRALRERRFDHVIANPPYYLGARGLKSGKAGRDTALWEQTPLSIWLDVAAKRLAPKGVLSLIQDAARLPDLFQALPATVGSLEILPLAARVGRRARRVLLRARKGGNAEFSLHAPFALHDGAEHLSDFDDYSDAVKGILRDAEPLLFPAARQGNGQRNV